MWLALDPPGRPDRSLGSIVATATSGPLRHGFGPVRDHVLGCTVATGDGRLVKAGGRVVKNVAGYDLTKLQVGGFGGFGIIAEAHLRLRALPRADVTLLARGARDDLTAGGARRSSRRRSHRPRWSCSLPPWQPRPNGCSPRDSSAPTPPSRPMCEPRLRRRSGLAAAAGRAYGRLLGGRGPRQPGGADHVRLGVLADGVDEMMDLVAHDLDEGLLSAGPGAGMIRWTGDAPIERLRGVRRAAASREIPMTIERAPWAAPACHGPLWRLPRGRGPARRETARELRSRPVPERGAGGSGVSDSARPVRPLRILPAGLSHLSRHRR